MRPALRALARLRARWPSPFRPSVTVLGFHRVDVEGGDLAVRPDTFARQMKLLGSLSLPTLSLDTVLDLLDEGGFDGRAVVLTFDDAWADNHRHAFGPLAEYGLPATVYAPSRLLGTPGYMTPAQLLEMAAAGIDVGAHTRTHPDLRRCSDAELEAEVGGSKADLEDLLGREVTSFAYPTGLFDERVEAAVRAAGYRSAVTTRRGWLQAGTARHRIPRSFVEEFDDATFRASTSGGLTALRPVDALRNLSARR